MEIPTGQRLPLTRHLLRLAYRRHTTVTVRKFCVHLPTCVQPGRARRECARSLGLIAGWLRTRSPGEQADDAAWLQRRLAQTRTAGAVPNLAAVASLCVEMRLTRRSESQKLQVELSRERPLQKTRASAALLHVCMDHKMGGFRLSLWFLLRTAKRVPSKQGTPTWLPICFSKPCLFLVAHHLSWLPGESLPAYTQRDVIQAAAGILVDGA